MQNKNIVNPERITGILCLVILVFSLAQESLNAQVFPFYKYSVNDGLSSAKVYSVLQDNNDYLWLGTESGLSRFDGLSIENFTVNDGLARGGVKCIYEDIKGYIWFGHLDGKISFFNGDHFAEFIIDSLDISGDITSIFEYRGALWFTTSLSGAVSVFIDYDNIRSGSSNHYRGGEGLSDQVFSSYIDREGSLYCLADVGIKKYDPDDDKFMPYKPEGMTSYFSTVVFYEDSRGDRWFGTYHGGLYRMDANTGEFKVYDIRDGLANNWISCITEDHRGRVWVGTFGGGISVFSGDQIQNFNAANGLNATHIYSLAEDQEGNMLITSQKNGLIIYKGDHFTHYVDDRLFVSKNITAVNADKYSRLWFGNYNGVTIYDPDSRISWRYLSEDEGPGRDITTIKNDLDGNIWIGTNGEGIFKYRFSENVFTREDRINDILYKDLRVTSMAVDKENNLWIGTNDGVAIWCTGIETGDRYTQSKGLSGNEISSLFVDKEGCVWIGTKLKNGLTRYNPTAGIFSIIETGYDLSPTTITQTADGTIWFGTTFGIMAMRHDTLVDHLTTDNGLLSNDVKLLEADDRGYLYIGTNSGLNRLNTLSGKMDSFTAMNGFTGIQTNYNAVTRDKKGYLWFGTVNGVSRLNPDLIPEREREPLTHIKGLTVNLEPREMSDGMKLTHKEKSLVFDYYSICLTDPEAVRYRVMLQGAEPDWGSETRQTRATYPSLSPGKYTFMVKAVNSSGLWNSQPVSYSFTIKPPFYFSTPFILAMIFLLLLGIWAYIKVRERNLVKEKQILEEKVEERTAEVVEKSKVIEQKNRDITASIRYAERIQMAMLPPEDSFEHTFVLFKPKDIVSGDFYWMHDSGEKQFLAAVDCTGHGVPGAFMSIIGSNSLTKIVREYGIIQPAEILDQLNVEVTKSLLRRGETVINDGMDLALISFSLSNGRVEYAGAYNPLVILRDGKIINIKADRFPIGMVQTGKRKFKNNIIEVRSGDMLYIFSDGFADQFGGPDSKKFKSVNLKNEFRKIYNLPVESQKDHLLAVLDKWMGDKQGQVDDILIIGTRIP